MTVKFTWRRTFLFYIALLGASGCAETSGDGVLGTNTGNPPNIDRGGAGVFGGVDTPRDCSTDTDCAERWPDRERPQWCTVHGTCAECVSDMDCGTPPSGARFGCAGGQCAEIQLDACEDAGDCGNRLGCVDGFCRSCETDADCGPGGACLGSGHSYEALAAFHDGCFRQREVDPLCLEGTCPFECAYDSSTDTGCAEGCIVCAEPPTGPNAEDGD